MNIADTLKQGKQRLAGSESANLDTEVLLCSILNCERGKLYSHPEQTLSEKELNSFNELISLREQGHPVAHLCKQKEFWSLSFHITPDTLIPRPETELLVETALKQLPIDSEKHILDLGTGSGAIAIAIASERPSTKITATDKSENALKIARRNAETHNIKNIEFKNSDWFEKENNLSYDLIVSNPPYICNDDPHLKQGDVQFEPHSALTSGNDGLHDLRIIISESKKYLNKDAWLLVEHGYNQAEQVRELFIKNDFISVTTIKDYSNHDRVSIGQLK